MFPLLDIAGFKRRSLMPPTDVDLTTSLYAGFFEARRDLATSFIGSRLRKRYIWPPGQTAPLLLAAGTTPPPVTLLGVPTLGSMQIAIDMLVGGIVGAATFQWSQDGGLTFAGPLTTGASVSLPGTGLVAVFSPGTYNADNDYMAAPPVPETVQRWLVAMVTRDFYLRRGTNPQDPGFLEVKDDVTTAIAEMKEAADGKDGLIELPVTEDQGTAVAIAGPMSYSENSPYVWQDVQRETAWGEDCARTGTGQSVDS